MDCCCCSVNVTPYENPANAKIKEEDQVSYHDIGCFGCLQKRLHILPIVSVIWFGISLITTYAISVSLGHTEAGLPYISRAAVGTPETNIFAQMINIGAVLIISNAIVRYLYVKETLFRQMSTTGWFRANIASFAFGITTAIGFSMVANFQTDNVKSVHYLGAGLGLGGGTIYCWIQTFITWKLYRRELHRGNVAIIQTVNSVALVLLLLMFGISKIVYNTQKAANVGTKHDTLKSVYLVSTITEWLSVILLNVFLLTFIPDFKTIKLKSPQIYQLVKIEDYTEKTTQT